MQSIFKWFVGCTVDGRDYAPAYVNWFVNALDKREFTGVERLLFMFLSYCDELGISAKRKFLESFLNTEGKKIIKYENIRIDDLKLSYDEPGVLEEAYRVIGNAALTLYDEYMKTDLTEHVFKVDMKAYFEVKRSNSLQNAMATSFADITSGVASQECIEVLQEKLDTISYSYDDSKLDDLDFIRPSDNPKREKSKMRFVTDFGLPCIDQDAGGIYSKQIINVTGQPGSGKTRLAVIHGAYQCAVINKKGVLISELELTAAEVENILISHHIARLYGGKIKIPDKLINRDQLTDEQRRYVESARIDLFESGKYGRIIIQDKNLIVEEMRRKALSFFRLNKDIELWVIDYAGMARSVPISKYDKKLDKADIIESVFDNSKSVAKIADIGVLIVSQYTKEGNEAAFAGKRIIPGMVQGGQSIQRYADLDIAMTMTEEQEISGIRCLSTVKKRSATGFYYVPLRTDLSVSIFEQLPVTAVS